MAGSIFDANQSDFLGEGTAYPVLAPQQNLTPLQQQESDLARRNFTAVQNNVPYGTPVSQGGTATTWQQQTYAPGTAAGRPIPGGVISRPQDAQGNPQNLSVYENTTGPNAGQASYDARVAVNGGNQKPGGYAVNMGMAGADPSGLLAGSAAASGGGQFGLANQVQSARDAGANFVTYGNQALQNTQAQANSLLAQGQAFSPQAQQVAGGFGVGQRSAAPGMVNTSQLGALNTNVAGGLGAAPKVTASNVGMVKTTAAPGAVTPQLGNQGASGADQQSMLSRVNGFLDAPQGPSVAEAQLRQAQADNAAQLMGAARSGRGTSGDQAEALREAMAGGSALMSDTAGQLATLRAQETDMRANRNLSAMGLGGQIATDTRGQDLGYRGQNLASLQGDQATSLGARGQNLQASQGNQSAQLGLEQLRGQLGLGARGQNLSALQSDQGAQLAARGQTLAGLQGNQSTELGARGQDVQARAQDLAALTGDADRGLAAQQLGLQGQLGLSGLGLQAQGQGLQASSQQNALGLGAEGMAQDAINQANRNNSQQSIASDANASQLAAQQAAIDARPSFWEQLALNATGSVGNALGGGIGSIFSPSPQAPAPAANPYNPGSFGGAGGVY